MAVLVLLDSSGERRIEVGDRIVIGRDAASDLVLDDPMVSLRHAEVRRGADGFEISDLGTRHGTYVRETRIKQTSLKDGDEILLGVHRLRFEERATAPHVASEDGGLCFDDVTPPYQTRIAVQRTHFRTADELSEAELRSDYEKLRAAFEIAAAAGGEREARPLLERILHTAVSVMGAERTAAVLVDPRDGTPFLRLSVNQLASDEPVSLSTKLLAEVMRRREGVMVGGAQVTQRSESMTAQRIRTAMCAPLLFRDQVLGVLYVDSRITGRRFEQKDLEVLVALANQAAGALQAALTIEEVERVRSEERERTERVLRHLPEGVVLLDGERCIAFANDAAAGLLELLGVARGGPLPEALAGLRLAELADGRIHRFEAARRPRRILEAAATRTDDRGGLLLVLRDVTSERVREEEAERQERLAIVGRLVAGIAHDLNNVLTVILTFADAIRSEESIEEAQACARDIADAGRRAARLNRQLLVFSSSSSGELETVDVSELVEEIGRLWGRILADRMKLQIRCRARPALVRIDRSHLEQAILNLIVNARDAVQPGGSLVLEIGEADGSIEILAIDDGVGMEPEIAERIFEPFFTTKGDAGTGLGLATVHRVVTSAGGAIDVRSQPGAGTTFRIRFPRAVLPARARSESVPARVARSSTVLVVEDHAAVREAAARALRAAGHRVLTAGTAEEAIRLASDGAVDVLVADLVLPGMTGLDLAATLRRRRPDLHVVYVSGYLDAGTSARVAGEGARFLAKPFGGDALIAQVADRLDDGD